MGYLNAFVIVPMVDLIGTAYQYTKGYNVKEQLSTSRSIAYVFCLHNIKC